MQEPKTLECEKCHIDANVIGIKPVTPNRASGFLALIDCPKCGEREQWLPPVGQEPKHT